MFTKRDYLCFLSSTILIGTAYFLMIIDPVEYGFGVLTLWIAPPLLLLGFLLPVVGIIGVQQVKLRNFFAMKNNVHRHVVSGIVFLIALFTYLITIEPTASLWDCSEFIASAYKLQVPHSPGNPFFLLIARIFSMSAFSPMDVAVTINSLSAIFSALTVYIVFHLICLFGDSISTEEGNNKRTILGGVVGSLCLTFSDSFWFSAVEAETYAAASFFLMLLVWLIFTGSTLTADSRSRRLILIFYISGLSYCVHPMCLIALSLLPFYWYTDREKVTFRSLIVTLIIGLLIVVVINRTVAVGFFELLFSFDLFFVNSLRLPFYSGAIAMILLFILFFVFLLRRFKNQWYYAWAVIFLLVGFLPYFMLFIRSNRNPPIDETNPENLALIKAYMNRESYMSAPQLYGPYFDAEVESVAVKSKMYYKDSNAYKIAGTTSEYQYDRKRQTILPRMYSNEENNIAEYRQWTGLIENELPTFGDNLEFMFRFQLGEMYFRYLMFNFAGRESDVQYSSWLKPWDSLEGPVPNNARNQYWMLPLLLAIGGSIFHYQKDRRNFLAVLVFFSVTGWLLATYLNSPPNEPRERDYIYVGSYIACSFWIGLGVVGLVRNFQNKIFFWWALVLISVPAWMAYQNFDDHDRRGRTFQMDNSRNLLQSCAPNSILFTGGDNDTFPLWYLQEVEGFRTDVRVMVLSYFNTDWYINQLRRAYYNSPAFKLSLTAKDYLQYGANDVIYVHETIKEGIDASKYLHLLRDEHPGLRVTSNTGEPYSILPSRSLIIPIVNSDVITKVSNDQKEINQKMILTVSGNYITKNSLAILDVLVSNKWERPMYFNFTSYNQLDLNIKPYLVQEGLVYRLVPLENPSKDVEPDTKLMFQNLVTNANYNNLARSDVYFNHEDYHARMIDPLRSAFNLLTAGLIYEGDVDRANAVMDKALHDFYPDHLKPSFSNLQTADLLLAMGRTAEAQKLSADLFDWNYLQVEADMAEKKNLSQINIFLLRRSAELLQKAGRPEYGARLQELNF